MKKVKNAKDAQIIVFCMLLEDGKRYGRIFVDENNNVIILPDRKVQIIRNKDLKTVVIEAHEHGLLGS